MSLYWAAGGLVGGETLGREIDRLALPWHLALWDPFWLLGGLLFLVATRTFRRSRER